MSIVQRVSQPNHKTTSVAKILSTLALGICAVALVVSSYTESTNQAPQAISRVDIPVQSTMQAVDVQTTSTALQLPPPTANVEMSQSARIASSQILINQEAIDSPSVEAMDATFQQEYTIFWEGFLARAFRQADTDRSGTVNSEELDAFSDLFFGKLGFTKDKNTGFVYNANGVLIKPTTLICYLNGYVPEKDYIKPNCPTE